MDEQPGQAPQSFPVSGRGPHPLPLFLSLALRVVGHDRARMANLLEGLRRYQSAPLPPPMPGPAVVASRGGVRLLDFGGPAGGRMLVFLPSLINAPAVLDLAPGRSLVRHMAEAGFRTFMVDWGPTGPAERRLGLAGLVSARLLPLLRGLDGRLSLIGYCLGGTLAMAAACHLGPRLERLALLATPWHFSGYSDDARKAALSTWHAIRPLGRTLGAVPVSLLNPLFWSLDEAGVIAKFEALARRPEGDPHSSWFAAVEDWANSGAPLSLASARDLFEHGYAQNRTGRGLWRVGGRIITPDCISAPILDLGATRDHLVPAPARPHAHDERIRRIDVAAGHVGMVVGSRAPDETWAALSNWLRTG